MAGKTPLRLTQRYAALIDTALARLLDQLASDLKHTFQLSQLGDSILAQLREYTLRPGKRVRGSLAAAAYDSAAGEGCGAAGIQLGAVLELLQSYILIVDDVMDRADVRRGGPTLQLQCARVLPDAAPKDTADMVAICAGLIMQHAANVALGAVPVPAERVQAAQALLHRNLLVTGFGQIDDLAQRADTTVGVHDVLRTLRLKTSYYTFVAPIQAGLSLARQAHAAELDAVQRFGAAAGIAFQLHDDYLDVFGSPVTLGKQPGGDIREGTHTLLLEYAMERATPAQLELLRQIVGNADADDAAIAAVRDVFTATDAAARAAGKAALYIASARQELTAGVFGTAELRDMLAELLDYMTVETQGAGNR